MTLPASGLITLLNIQTEFGGPTPVALTNYYRGGTYVPNIAANANVPTSGLITLTNFYSAVNIALLIVNETPTAIGAFAGFGLQRAGTQSYDFFSVPQTADWIAPKNSTVGDAWEVRVTRTGGITLTGSAQGTWLALSSNRAWSQTGYGSTSCTVEIGAVGTSTAQITATYSLSSGPV